MLRTAELTAELSLMPTSLAFHLNHEAPPVALETCVTATYTHLQRRKVALMGINVLVTPVFPVAGT